MPLVPRSDTLVITSYPPSWRGLRPYTVESHKRYADKMGWDFHEDESELTDCWYDWVQEVWHEKVPIRGFRKLDLFLHFLPHYKTVIWLDADLVVTNPVIDIMRGFDWNSEAELILPYDYNGHNATVIIARSTDRIFQFFWACNNTGRKLFLKHDWKEMEAMRYFLQTPPYIGVVEYESIKFLCPILHTAYLPYVPERVSKEYGWEPGDFSLHLSALPVEHRIELARHYFTKVYGT